MNKIYIFAILIAVASAHLAVDIASGTVNQDSWNCLAKKNFKRAIAQIANPQGSIYNDFRNTSEFARNAGIAIFDARLVVNDTMIPEQFSAAITKALPPSFNGTLWLSVFDRDNYWRQHGIDDRMAYLESYVLAFKQHGIRVGILSDLAGWTNIFGDRRAGSDILKALPLWYFDKIPFPSFEDWDQASFGTWDEPVMKQYDFSIDICSTRAQFFNYYETYN